VLYCLYDHRRRQAGRKLAHRSAELAHKALQKSNELEVYLSVLEYRSGKVRRYKWAYRVMAASKTDL